MSDKLEVELWGTLADLLSQETEIKIERSTKIKPRPVWRRHLQRSILNTEVLGPPTEEEIRDAVQVFKEAEDDPSIMAETGLWIEAHRILDETQ